jgi:uncharacterized membrane protein (DUF485 family)
MPPSSPDPVPKAVIARQRVSLVLSAVMLGVYFGFIALGAFAKGFMGAELTAGVSWGILLGALVIIVAFALTGVYVRWANAAEIDLDRDMISHARARDEGNQE